MISIEMKSDEGNKKEYVLYEDKQEIGCLTIYRKLFHVLFHVKITESVITYKKEWKEKVEKWIHTNHFSSLHMIISGERTVKKEIEQDVLTEKYKNIHMHSKHVFKGLETIYKKQDKNSSVYVRKDSNMKEKDQFENMKEWIGKIVEKLQDEGYPLYGQWTKSGVYLFDYKKELNKNMIFYYDNGYRVKCENEFCLFGDQISEEAIYLFFKNSIKKINEKIRLQELMNPEKQTFFYDKWTESCYFRDRNRIKNLLLTKMSIEEIERKSLQSIREKKKLEEVNRLGASMVRVYHVFDYYFAISVSAFDGCAIAESEEELERGIQKIQNDNKEQFERAKQNRKMKRLP